MVLRTCLVATLAMLFGCGGLSSEADTGPAADVSKETTLPETETTNVASDLWVPPLDGILDAMECEIEPETIAADLSPIQPDVLVFDEISPDVLGPSCTIDETIIEPGMCFEPPPFFPEVPLDEFQVLPNLHKHLGEIQFAVPLTYWEWRFCFGGSPDCEVVGSGGEKCADAADPETCIAAFDALQESSGFHEGCLPSSCYEYLAVNAGDEVWTVTNFSELRALLVPLAGPLEAAALVYADGYDIQSEASGGGWRAVWNGWEILATKVTFFCDPVVTTRYLLHVQPDGSCQVLCSQVAEVECGVCI